MSKLLINIGRCVVIAQQIEVALGMALVLERKDEFSTLETLMAGIAKTRLQVLESLKNELMQQGVSYLDFSKLDRIIERRNWLVHRLVLDQRFVNVGAGISNDDFTDVVQEMHGYYKELLSLILKRSSELGVQISPVGDPTLATFVIAHNIQQKTEELRSERRRK